MSRLPRRLDQSHLVLSHFSLARHHPIEDRLVAAGAGGFDGVGLYVGDVVALRSAGMSDSALFDLLTLYGVGLAEIEVARGWGVGSVASVDEESVIWSLADRFGARSIQAIGPFAGTLADAGVAFHGLCSRAADHGMVVALEPLPFTNIPDLATAVEVVERAGHPAGGLCLDIWHHTRAGDSLDAVRALGADRIMSVQMSDGPRRAPDADAPGFDYKDDCLRHRVPPGHGDMDAVAFAAAVLAAGTTVPWSVEVCDDSVWGRPATDHVARCGDAMRGVLVEARALLATQEGDGT